MSERNFFVFDADDGFQRRGTHLGALALGAEILRDYQVEAQRDGEWDSDVEALRVGVITHAVRWTGKVYELVSVEAPLSDAECDAIVDEVLQKFAASIGIGPEDVSTDIKTNASLRRALVQAARTKR